MANLATDGAQAAWDTPQCPFSIEYSARVLDDIRLAVVDAFFALPRGGAEIGGVLLGTQAPGRLAITGYQAIECEHATGPSFTLSQKDETKLRDQLASVTGQVVGWYHSHTRSGIFLSDADLDIHQRFFPEPWQIALVMKPHTFQPMRVGLFFRERDGSIRASAPYQEMQLEPLPMQQVPSGQPPSHPPENPAPGRPIPDGPIIDLLLPKKEPAPAPVPPAAETEPEPPLPPPPSFLVIQPEASRRWRVALAIGASLALGAAGFQTRESWRPRLMAAFTSVPSSSPPSLGLNALDSNGQLQIRWDRSSLPVRTGVAATLEIADGADALPQSIPMDPQHLQAGVFTYGRQGQKVEVKLTIRMPDGRETRQVTTFLGALPPRVTPPEDPEVRRQREEQAKEAAQLKSDLAAQEKRTRELERSLSDAQKTIKQQQLRRLKNQVPAK